MSEYDADPNQGASEVEPVEQVQSQEGDQGLTDDQSVQPTVGGEIEIGGEKFTVDSLKSSYAELRKKFTQESQRMSQERKAAEWLTNRLREIQTSSPQDWQSLRGLLNGKKQPTAPQQGQTQSTQVDPRFSEYERSQKMTEAKLELMEFQRKHPDVDEAALRDLVTFVIEKDVEGREYTLDDAYIIKNHKNQLAQAVETTQKKTEESVQRGKQAVSLGTGATTAQTKPKPKNFFKIKDENEANKYIEDAMKRAGVKFDSV